MYVYYPWFFHDANFRAAIQNVEVNKRLSGWKWRIQTDENVEYKNNRILKDQKLFKTYIMHEFVECELFSLHVAAWQIWCVSFFSAKRNRKAEVIQERYIILTNVFCAICSCCAWVWWLKSKLNTIYSESIFLSHPHSVPAFDFSLSHTHTHAPFIIFIRHSLFNN